MFNKIELGNKCKHCGHINLVENQHRVIYNDVCEPCIDAYEELPELADEMLEHGKFYSAPPGPTTVLLPTGVIPWYNNYKDF